MSDARDRRRQHHEQANKFDLMATLKKFMIPIIIVAIWGSVVAFQFAPEKECPGHWHAGYAVFVDGQEVPFNPNAGVYHPSANPDGQQWGDAGASPGSGFHIHGDDGLLHMHPATTRCIESEDIFKKLDVKVAASTLTLDAPHALAGTYTTNDTHEVAVYHRAWNGDWDRVNKVGSFMKDQLGNGDQILITYIMKGDTATLQAQQDAVRSLVGDPSYEPGPAAARLDDTERVNIIAVTLFAGVALFIWNKFRVRY